MEYPIQPFMVYQKGNLYGIMNARKEFIVPCTYPDLWIDKIEDGILHCEAVFDDTDLDGLYTFIFNEQGIMLIPDVKTEFNLLPNGLIAIENDEHAWGFVNRQNDLTDYQNITFHRFKKLPDFDFCYKKGETFL